MESKKNQQMMPSYDDLLLLFRKVDTNNSGCISVEELHEALSANTLRPFNRETINILLELVDKNKSGTVNFEEFGALYKYIASWLKWYHSFDFNESGLLDCKELRHALYKLGYQLTIDDVAEYMQAFDRSGTGHIDFDDFVQVCDVVAKKHPGLNVHDKIVQKVMS